MEAGGRRDNSVQYSVASALTKVCPQFPGGRMKESPKKVSKRSRTCADLENEQEHFVSTWEDSVDRAQW